MLNITFDHCVTATQVRCLTIELHDRFVPNCSTHFYAAMKDVGFTRRDLGKWGHGELECWCNTKWKAPSSARRQRTLLW